MRGNGSMQMSGQPQSAVAFQQLISHENAFKDQTDHGQISVIFFFNPSSLPKITRRTIPNSDLPSIQLPRLTKQPPYGHGL